MLQSDGYNVYMYIVDNLIDTEHLCCLAYVWAKFKYASEQGRDKDALISFWILLETFTGWRPNMRKAS